jgi:peptidoglycan glycosyltransferase
MEPQVVDRIVSPSGKTLVKERPTLIRRAVSPSTAHAVADMMRQVVLRGTGTAAQIPGYTVGGKTGTAETGTPTNTTWFIAFAGKPDRPPEIAIAVVLQNQTGVGGTTAAPIAKTVMEALLHSAENP